MSKAVLLCLGALVLLATGADCTSCPNIAGTCVFVYHSTAPSWVGVATIVTQTGCTGVMNASTGNATAVHSFTVSESNSSSVDANINGTWLRYYGPDWELDIPAMNAGWTGYVEPYGDGVSKFVLNHNDWMSVANCTRTTGGSPNSLAVPWWVPDCDCHRAIWREFWDPAHACPTWVRMTVTLAVPESVGFDAQGLVEAVAKAAGVQEPTRVKVGSTQVSPTLSGHTDVDISVRVPHSEDLMNASAAIRDALNAAEAEQAIGVAVGASVDVSNGPFIDEARTRSSWAELQCSPGLQCGDAGCPKCVCDCTIPCSAA